MIGQKELDAMKTSLTGKKSVKKLPYAERARRLQQWLNEGRSEEDYYIRRDHEQAEIDISDAAEAIITSRRKPIDLPAAAEELQATARAENGEPRMIRPGGEVLEVGQ